MREKQLRPGIVDIKKKAAKAAFDLGNEIL